MINQNSIAKQHSRALADMTKISKKDREKYLQWFGEQDESIVIMIVQRIPRRSYHLKQKYRNIYLKPVIFIAAMIQVIELFMKVDNQGREIDISHTWFGKKEVNSIYSALFIYKKGSVDG